MADTTVSLGSLDRPGVFESDYLLTTGDALLLLACPFMTSAFFTFPTTPHPPSNFAGAASDDPTALAPDSLLPKHPDNFLPSWCARCAS